jgi:uncharacterized radical SAM superfamily Fe-S cluster-containing enzyme
MAEDIVHNETKAVCPECREIVAAQVVEKDGKIYLKKNCPDHGVSYALTCSDADWYRESTYFVKPAQDPMGRSVSEFKGCPDSCGLCPQHKQHTCLPIIEISNVCNMDCPICLKDPDNEYHMDKEQYRGILTRLLEYEPDLSVINLSGGEPTIHPQFEDLLNISKEMDINQVTVSTNGMQLFESEKMRQLFKETGTIASLQFDGFKPGAYEKLRGSDLSARKLEIIKLLEESGVSYSLVVTVARGINDDEITDIVDFFFKSKAVSLMFQPAAFTGNASNQGFNPDENRITVPDVVREIEKSMHVKKGDFMPIACAHYSCATSSYYLIIDEGDYLSLTDFIGKENYIDILANRTYPGLDEKGYDVIKEGIYDLWSLADSSDKSEHVLKRLREIFDKLNECCFTTKHAFDIGIKSLKSIFIHQFMDVHTMDIERLMKCCHHYPQADGRLIPCCAQNVFFQSDK